MTDKPKTLSDVLKAASDYLAGKSLENPQLLCEMLAARLLKCKRLELPLSYGSEITEKQLEAMRRGTKRLAEGEPVQYIIGETEFMGHLIKTDRRALIPRPETERLIETVLDTDELWQRERPVIVEIGTGSGCMTISLALAKPDALYTAFDTSPEAIGLARENAATHRLGQNVAFADSDMSDVIDPESVDALIANLPYIPTDEYEKLPVQIKKYEPRMALDGGEDGLRVIEPTVHDASFALKPGGFLFLEIGETQAETVTSIMQNAGFTDITVRKDLNSRDRVISARLLS